MTIVQSNYFIKKTSLLNLEEYLCPEIRELINKIPRDIKNSMEEIRLRINQPLMIYASNQDLFINKTGNTSLVETANTYKTTKKDIDTSLQFISNYSIYSVEEELKRGYITVQGGHRVGIVGRVLWENGEVKTMKEFTGLNFRISREKIGVASKVLRYLISDEGEFVNTLIVSPPQCGKTTLLRDIIRNLSNGIPNLNLKGLKVALVDERSEIGACYQGIPQNDLGIRTDILDGCPKAQGMMMLIRAMSPEVIATDEIGRDDDAVAIYEAILAGIKLITTVHGRSLEDVVKKKVIGGLVEDSVFQRIIILSNREGVGTIDKIINGDTLQDCLYSPIKNRVV